MLYKYPDSALEQLSRDTAMRTVIERLGYVEREVEEELFAASVHQIVGQQISMTAMHTVCKRLGELTPCAVLSRSLEELRGCGMSEQKARAIHGLAELAQSGQLDSKALQELSDAEIIARLTAIRGIGVWTAEMVLIFGLHRDNVLSYGDFGIRRGIRMLYGIEQLDKRSFEHFRELYSPYGTTASLYLWAVSGGAIPELHDPAASR